MQRTRLKQIQIEFDELGINVHKPITDKIIAAARGQAKITQPIEQSSDIEIKPVEITQIELPVEIIPVSPALEMAELTIASDNVPVIVAVTPKKARGFQKKVKPIEPVSE